MMGTRVAEGSETGIDALLSEPGLVAALSAGLESPPGATAASMALSLAHAFGPAAVAVVHYGSRARAVDARPDSAYDFFVVVDDYRSAYRSLASTMHVRGAFTAPLLAPVLAPNVHAIPPAPDGRRRNKCGVISAKELRAAAALRARDHFLVGRLFQHVQILWTRDTDSRNEVVRALVELRARTFEWGRSFLPDTFTAESYCATLLRTSFAGEVRPEGAERAADLLSAQRDTLVPVYGALLEALVAAGVLEKVPGGYRQLDPPPARVRRRWRRYFRRSKARGIARWAKAVAQYDGWVDYIHQKITRHNDVDVELTERERRWPFVFLWPKIFLFFRDRSRWEARR